MADVSEAQPLRALGLLDSVCIMAGIIIGVGIYETPSQIAAALPNEAAFLGVWILGGVLSLAGALCYAELASAYPEQGGDYVYLNRAYGGWAGYLFAWGTFVIMRPGSIAALAFPFADYLGTFWPALAEWRWQLRGTEYVAVGAVVLLTAINCVHVQAGARTQTALTLAKAAGLVLVFAAAFAAPAAAGPAAPPAAFPGGGMGLALILVLFTYGGWQEICYVAAEVKNPARNMTRSIILALLAVSVLYLMANLAFLRSLGLERMAGTKAVAAEAVAAVFPVLGRKLIAALVCISALGAVNGMILTGARVSYALGRDYQIFRWLSGWHPARSTPVRALIIQGAIAAAIILAAGSFSGAVVYTTGVVWIFFVLAGFAVVRLRVKEPGVHRPYRVAGYPLTPLIFCAAAAYTAWSALRYDLKGSLIAMAILLAGLPFQRKVRG